MDEKLPLPSVLNQRYLDTVREKYRNIGHFRRVARKCPSIGTRLVSDLASHDVKCLSLCGVKWDTVTKVGCLAYRARRIGCQHGLYLASRLHCESVPNDIS